MQYKDSKNTKIDVEITLFPLKEKTAITVIPVNKKNEIAWIVKDFDKYVEKIGDFFPDFGEKVKFNGVKPSSITWRGSITFENRIFALDMDYEMIAPLVKNFNTKDIWGHYDGAPIVMTGRANPYDPEYWAKGEIIHAVNNAIEEIRHIVYEALADKMYEIAAIDNFDDYVNFRFY